MRKRRHWIQFYPDDEEQKIIREEFFQTNLQRWKLYLWIAIPLSLLHLVLFIANLDPDNVPEYTWRKQIILMHMVLIMFAVFFGIYAYSISKKRLSANGLDRFMPAAFSILLMLSGVIVTIIDQQVTTSITPFLVVCLASGLILMIRPIQLIIIDFSAYILFVVLMTTAQNNPDVRLSNDANGLTLVGFSLGLSILLWNINLKRYRQSRLIQQQKAALEEGYQKLSDTARELEKANTSKDLFFSIIAHDLVGPISGLSAYLEVLEQESKEHHDQVADKVSLLRNSVDNTQRLLENLLTWARAQRNEILFRPEPVDLFAILNNAIQSVVAQAIKKRISIRVPNDNQSLMINGDTNMLETVFRNLLSNAIKFSYPESEIHILAAKTSDNVEIKIIDQGIGISQINQEKLFQTGEKITSWGTESEKGTGLGLILCQDFIHKHDGRIRVESLPGSGSTFIVELPC